jgi:preprotein translocase subunit SecF
MRRITANAPIGRPARSHFSALYEENCELTQGDVGKVGTMTARTIVGACVLAVLAGVAIYLLLQIPWEFGIGGLVALVAILFTIAHDAPDPL